MPRDQQTARPTGMDTPAFERHFREIRQAEHEPTPKPWPLALVVFACAAVVVVGSIGPWEYYQIIESGVVVNAWTLYGPRTDGAFSMVFAVGGVAALLVALLGRDAAAYAWVAAVFFGLCVVTGIGNWLLFGPTEVELAPAEDGTIVRQQWGPRVVGLAGLGSAVSVAAIARIMNRG